MTIGKSDHGIVVEDVETGLQYAISDSNYSVKKHRKIRDLGPGESRLTYQPRRREPLGSLGTETSGGGTHGPAGEAAVVSGDSQQDTKTEGANTGTQEKEGK